MKGLITLNISPAESLRDFLFRSITYKPRYTNANGKIINRNRKVKKSIETHCQKLTDSEISDANEIKKKSKLIITIRSLSGKDKNDNRIFNEES
jgi:hypothetical protein